MLRPPSTDVFFTEAIFQSTSRPFKARTVYEIKL
jgi:hypothetical protein